MDDIRHDDSWGFMKLTGENRNMIYEYALVDSSGKTLHVVPTCSLANRDLYCCKWNSGSERVKCPPTTTEKLPVALLRTCKQINMKASSILYARKNFSFDSHIQCLRFLELIHIRLPFIRKLTLTLPKWCEYSRHPYHLQELRPVFKLIDKVERLEYLEVDFRLWSNLASQPKTAAAKLCNIASKWLNRFAADSDDKLAALDVIRLPTRRDGRSGYYLKWEWWHTQEGLDVFREELGKFIRPKRSTSRLVVLGK